MFTDITETAKVIKTPTGCDQEETFRNQNLLTSSLSFNKDKGATALKKNQNFQNQSKEHKKPLSMSKGPFVYETKGLNVKVSMESSGNNMVLNKANAEFKVPVTSTWNLFGQSHIKLKTNNTTRIIFILLILFVATAALLNYRIQVLENQNSKLENQLTDVQDRLFCVMLRISQIQGIKKISGDNDNIQCSEEYMISFDNDESDDDDQNDAVEDLEYPQNDSEEAQDVRVRRSVYASGTGNGSSKLELANTSGTRTAKSSRKRERGNNNQNNTDNSWKLYIAKAKIQRDKDQTRAKAAIAQLKNKLETARKRTETAKALANSYKLKLQQPSSYRKNVYNDPRAVYLTVRDPTIAIKNPEQLIGPWHIADSGADMGFNDLWYKNLALDDNGTRVMFQENGLYLVYAQVFYKSTQRSREKPAPMGFRIYLKKNDNVSVKLFHRPIPIAECVPSFPSTFYQTCFTQICWYIEEGDEIYLEHFTDAKPVIEAEKMGQTFLGVVRLSS